MNNIRNIHKSLTFTILVIVSTFIGIIFSLNYTKSNNNYLFQESFNNSSDVQNVIYSKYDHDYVKDKLDIVSLEYRKYPMDSVPVKVVLGKIKKIERPYLPKLHLAFLESDKNIKISNVNYLSLD